MSNSITFLGTAGARVMVANQFQASGGIWLDFDGTQILIDPGPGSIVQATRRHLMAANLEAIILSHRHLDHSGDMNIMIEAMTQGGFEPHGTIFLPADAMGPEPVVFSYLKEYINGIQILREGGTYSIDGVSFSTPLRHIHTVETYGLKFSFGNRTLSYIADSRFFTPLVDNYRSDVIIINVVFIENHFKVDHLSVADVEKIVTGIRPQVAILTHFGMQLWRANPDAVAAQLTNKTGCRVISARDGMVFDMDNLEERAS
jgi:ribonuclease BN (tRNA processing enzyme)